MDVGPGVMLPHSSGPSGPRVGQRDAQDSAAYQPALPRFVPMGVTFVGAALRWKAEATAAA